MSAPLAARPALVIIDLLGDFFDQVLWPQSDLPAQRAALVEGLRPALAWFRRHREPVLWVRQEFAPDLADAFPHMRRSGRAYTLRGTPGAQILPELEVRPAEPVLVKKRFSAFFGTDLEARLRALQATTVVLAGITTSWCVRSTATDAYQHDLEVLLYRDCLGGFQHEAHIRDLAAMDGYIARLIAREDLDSLRPTRR